MNSLEKLRSLNADQLKELIDRCDTQREILRELGINPKNGTARQILRKSIEDKGLKPPRNFNQWRHYSKEDFKEAVRKSYCFSDVSRNLGIIIHSNNTKTIRKLIKEYDIDISHFDVKKTYRRNKKEYLFDEIFVKDSPVLRHKVRTYVLSFNVLDYLCKKCGNEGNWMDEVLVLQLDHINGDSKDNRIENLRFLCPNCHTQTNTFCRKNIKKNN
jgi:hypothetical protein